MFSRLSLAVLAIAILSAPLTPKLMAQSEFQAIEMGEKVDGKVVGVRLWDFWKYLPKVVEDLKNVESTLMNSPERFLNVGEVKKVYNLFLRAEPTLSGSTYKLPLTYFLRDSRDVLRFEKVDILYTTASDMRAIPQGSVLLSQTHFSVNVALIDRKVIIEDRDHDLMMVFPVGVGSFDASVLHQSNSLLTPRFKDAFLDKRTNIYSREKPRYFAGKPFIRITTNETPEKGWTGIGFHAQPSLGQFVRAFDSHGCMRLQLEDLYTLYWIVAQGPRQHTRVSVSYEIPERLEHPFPKRDIPWKKVNNVGSTMGPMYNIDRDGLVEVVSESRFAPPIFDLIDQEDDNYHSVYNYDLDWREKERLVRHEQMCRASYLGGKSTEKLFGIGRSRAQRNYEKCVKEGKRDLDLGDRLYRVWIN